jgi:subfamily B ATP-binding cassette protein MsbA
VLLLALAASIVAPAASMVMPFAAKLVVDDVIGRRRTDLLLRIAFAAGLGLAVQSGATYLAAHLGALGAGRVVTRLRRQLQRHVLRLPARFFRTQQSGALAARIIGDTDQIRGLAGPEILQVVSAAVSAAIAFVVLWFTNWQLTAMLAVLLGVLTLALARGLDRLHPSYRTTSELQAGLAGRLTEVLGGIIVVKSCAAERREAYRLAQESHQLLRASISTSRHVSRLIATIALAIGGVSLVLLVVGGQAVAAGAMTLGDLALFVVLAGMLTTPLMQAAAIGNDLGRGLAALARIAELMACDCEDERSPGGPPVPACAPSVVFDDVSYGYQASHTVLQRVSFSAPPGSVTAVTGPNGAGKTTLLGLLMGLDLPTRGHILLDGVPLVSLRMSEYRRSLGVVLQQTHLFRGTIRENIRYGRPQASLTEFRRAARAAHCDEFVERLPQGYETQVGEWGVRLSGGQRQRIAIARAILGDPRILLLDEVTTGLDSESERLLQEALAALCSGRTAFVITHRPATIQRADQILVLRAGTIVERKTYAGN